MSTARKTKDGYYVVSFRDQDGKGRSRSFGKGREGKKRAEQFATEVDFNKAHGVDLPLSRAEGIYLDELCQLWVDEKKAQGRKPEWLREWVATFNKVFLPPLCKHPAHRITQADVIAIIGAHYAENAQATRNRYIGYLKSIFEYGVEQRHLKANPLVRWKKGKEPRRKSPLTMEDLQKVRDQCAPHLAWAIDVAWAIPCRPGPSDLYSLRFDRNVKPGLSGVEVYHSKVRLGVNPARRGLYALPGHQGEAARQRAPHRIQGPPSGAPGHVPSYGRPPGTAPLSHLHVRHPPSVDHQALDKGLEPSAIAYMAGTSVEMIHKNYYEPHAAEKARAVELMPRLREPKADPARKVVGIAVARLS